MKKVIGLALMFCICAALVFAGGKQDGKQTSGEKKSLCGRANRKRLQRNS